MDLINQAKRIFITSHFGPDPDAYASMLFTYGVLIENFPEKEIMVFNTGDLSSSFNFLKHFEKIQTGDFFESLNKFSPDLLIILDVPELARITRNNLEESREYISRNNLKTLWIDHHQVQDYDEKTILVNELRSSAVETAYKFFVWDNKLELFDGVANIVLLGIVGDTGRFMYKNSFHRDTFSIVSEMLDLGGSIEYIETRTKHFSNAFIQIYAEVLNNLKEEKEYNYTFVSEEKIYSLISPENKEDIRSGYHNAMDTFIRNYGKNTWGFIVLPDIDRGRGFYKVSFRATNESGIDTTKFTSALGGGGHKPASAAAGIKAENIFEAIKIIQEVIRKNLN